METGLCERIPTLYGEHLVETISARQLKQA